MRHRRSVKKMRPAVPAQEYTHLEVDYTCDKCGRAMLPHNMPRDGEEGTQVRNSLQVTFSRENASGAADGYEKISRDYCDDCGPGLWQAVSRLLAYPPDA